MPLGATQESSEVGQEAEGKETMGKNIYCGFCGKGWAKQAQDWLV